MIIITKFDVDQTVYYQSSDGGIKETTIKVIAVISMRRLNFAKVIARLFSGTLSFLLGGKPSTKEYEEMYILGTDIKYKTYAQPNKLISERHLYATIDEALDNIKLK